MVDFLLYILSAIRKNTTYGENSICLNVKLNLSGTIMLPIRYGARPDSIR